MKKNITAFFILVSFVNLHAQQRPDSQKVVITEMQIWSNSFEPRSWDKWNDNINVTLNGFDTHWNNKIKEPVVTNAPIELQATTATSATKETLLPTQNSGKEKTVLLDYYFNNEWKKDSTGKDIQWHYTWDETDNGGFSLFGDIWQKQGVNLSILNVAPTAANLKNADVYIIVDPDGFKDNPKPNFMDEKSAIAICNWVKKGGVLLLMANDSANCDLKHFNILSDKFGIHFSNKSRNMVLKNEFETGAVYNDKANPVFLQTKKMFLKDISAIEITSPATSVINKNKEVIFAMAKYGKGTVLALGDPWVYNEYLDGRRIPSEFENYKAATEMVKWLLSQTKNN